MATLNGKKKAKIRKQKMIISCVLFFSSLIVFPYFVVRLDSLLKAVEIEIGFWQSFVCLYTEKHNLQMFLLLEGIVILLIFMFLTNSNEKIGKSETIKITNKIEIPIACGEGQHGTSRFLTETEKRATYYNFVYDNAKLKNKNLGFVLGMEKEKKKKERIFCIEDDLHVLLIGSTRSGKTRRIILESIWLRSFTEKSMIVCDPKGELYLYTFQSLKSKGYDVIALDFRQPLKGNQYNYIENIIAAVDAKDIAKAIDSTWDLVSVMTGIPKGEPLWHNGESAVIAASILAVALEAPKECRNLTNVYYFIGYMCKENEDGEMPINKYFEKLPDNHPAKSVFLVAEISPDKMRGSFFGSALATLRLFTNWNIADMTSKSDFDLKNIGKKKTAVFIIVPDEKTTFYSLVTMFIRQAYMNLVEVANEFGGRLPCEVDMIWDEFGNMPSIPEFGTMLSVGAGRGIRFILALQDLQQLEKNYKEDYENIKGNCQITVYLKATSLKTLEELSKKTGPYTVQVNSVNSGISGRSFKTSSYSDSANMQSRSLLLPDEIGRIESPYALVLYAGQFPCIFISPDLSLYKANTELGLKDKEYNFKLIQERDAKRYERGREEIQLWEIWKKYKNVIGEKRNVEERVSFLE